MLSPASLGPRDSVKLRSAGGYAQLLLSPSRLTGFEPVSGQNAITLAASDLGSANGLAVSKDGTTLYVVETEDSRLLSFKIGPAGRLSERRLFVDLDEFTHHVGHILPDGVKIDSAGWHSIKSSR